MQPKSWACNSIETTTKMQDFITDLCDVMDDVYNMSSAMSLPIIPTTEELQA